jgi:hypothetical protein
MPMANTQATMPTFDGSGLVPIDASARANVDCSSEAMIMSVRRSNRSARSRRRARAAGAQGEHDDGDERGRLGEEVGPLREHHVLHPRTVLGRQPAGVDAPERREAQRGPGGAGSEGARSPSRSASMISSVSTTSSFVGERRDHAGGGLVGIGSGRRRIGVHGAFEATGGAASRRHRLVPKGEEAQRLILPLTSRSRR